MDWMMGHFQVLFSGQVVEGANQATVRQNLARRLGLDERKVAQLFSGRTVVIRSELSRNEADELQRELLALGALARIKDVSPDDRAKFKTDHKTRDQTLDITAHVECARCGHLQLGRILRAWAMFGTGSSAEDHHIEKNSRPQSQKTVAAPARSISPGLDPSADQAGQRSSPRRRELSSRKPAENVQHLAAKSVRKLANPVQSGHKTGQH
jgi:hypothetical protein